jgi:5-deoxy-glucuronate isomerase
VTDFAYVPRDAHVELATAQGGRFAIPSARAGRRLDSRRAPAEDVPVELRGAGQASRQVNNFCSPEAFEADRLIAVEVLTPSGNWSSYPPHKHDEEIPGVETALEAGPGERAWRFTDDPAHAWIRDTWAGQEVDPRLPMSSAGRRA